MPDAILMNIACGLRFLKDILTLSFFYFATFESASVTFICVLMELVQSAACPFFCCSSQLSP
jgi:hypothetical protein